MGKYNLRERAGSGKKNSLNKKPKKLTKKSLRPERQVNNISRDNPSLRELEEAPRPSLSRAPFRRPNFSEVKQMASRLEATLASGEDHFNMNLTDEDLAAPHRLSYAEMRDTVMNGTNKEVDNMVNEFLKASKHYETGYSKVGSEPYDILSDLYGKTRLDVESAFREYKQVRGFSNRGAFNAKRNLVRTLNNLASNAPGYGPHSTANRPVSDSLQLNPTGKPEANGEPLTPRSRAALEGSTRRIVAVDSEDNIIASTGDTWPVNLGPGVRTRTVDIGQRIARKALYVDENGNVFKPVNAGEPLTGEEAADWVKVTADNAGAEDIAEEVIEMLLELLI